MTPEKGGIPDWAARERRQDFEWIVENLHVFWPAATEAFVAQGRGAVVVDTTTLVVDATSEALRAGNLFSYVPQAEVEARDDEDVKRMVREYDPDWEFVIVLLKSQDRMSSYRVQPQPRQGNT